MPGLLAPTVTTLLDSNGNPISGGKVAAYLTGTSTPADTYADSALSTPNSWPAVADSAGRLVMYLDPAVAYKLVYKSAADVVLFTLDPVRVPDSGGETLGEAFVFGGDSTANITDTSYASGATLDKCHAGTRVLNRNSADIPSGTYVLEGVLLSLTGATVTAALVNLTDGSPDTPLVTISSSSTTGARARSAAITFAAAGAAKDYGVKTKVGSGTGMAWGFALIKTA